MKRAKVKMMMVPVAVVMVLALVMVLVSSVALAGKPPQFNEIYPTDVSVENTPPVMLNGGIAIIDNDGYVVWENVPDECKNCAECWPFPAGEPRSNSYIWESEKLVVYAIIHDDNGISDLKQHTAQAWLSYTDAEGNYEPAYRFLTDMELCQCTLNENQTEGCFMGEVLIPSPDMMRCHYDVTITDTDKYGATGLCNETGLPWNVVHDCLFINPMVTSQLSYTDPDTGERVPASAIMWMVPPLVAGETREADQSPFDMHIEARCNDLTVTVPYELRVRGTNLEGGIGNAESIPVENMEYSLDSGTTWVPMSNAEQFLGQYESCQYVEIHLKITVPWIEQADYTGEIGFDIKVL
jgi:hypothetical protein